MKFSLTKLVLCILALTVTSIDSVKASEELKAPEQISPLVETLNKKCDSLETEDGYSTCFDYYKENTSIITSHLLTTNDPNVRIKADQVRSNRRIFYNRCEAPFEKLKTATPEDLMASTAYAIVNCNSAMKSVFKLVVRYMDQENADLLQHQFVVYEQLPDCFAPSSFEAHQAAMEARKNGEEPKLPECNIVIPIENNDAG